MLRYLLCAGLTVGIMTCALIGTVEQGSRPLRAPERKKPIDQNKNSALTEKEIAQSVRGDN
jgi:hypothetical protein